ncbi:hypothetical protein D1BOALGB6SA_5166 [Olavius sp. associated proteobacterium Delta 1]|nr:hypothetical protein D1BOALGB6SA_5166 [Olavius sp. associated proteobacterium Delta 1]
MIHSSALKNSNFRGGVIVNNPVIAGMPMIDQIIIIILGISAK